MKILRIILVILFTVSVLSYMDSMVSDKYETQLEGFETTSIQRHNAEKLKHKLSLKKRISLSIIVVSGFCFIISFQIKKT